MGLPLPLPQHVAKKAGSPQHALHSGHFFRFEEGSSWPGYRLHSWTTCVGPALVWTAGGPNKCFPNIGVKSLPQGYPSPSHLNKRRYQKTSFARIC